MGKTKFLVPDCTPCMCAAASFGFHELRAIRLSFSQWRHSRFIWSRNSEHDCYIAERCDRCGTQDNNQFSR